MNRSHLEPRAELFARIDVAAICETLTVSVGGASRHDVHLFSYLASMVNSQYGASPSAWGYRFAASAEGLPFAEAVDFTMDEMIDGGDLDLTANGYQPSTSLRDRVATAESGSVFGERIALIVDVTNVAVFRTLPSIGRAVRSEPQLARSANIQSVRLVDEQELAETLMRLLLSVRERMKGEFPPSLPAMIWLDIWEQEREG